MMVGLLYRLAKDVQFPQVLCAAWSQCWEHSDLSRAHMATYSQSKYMACLSRPPPAVALSRRSLPVASLT